MIVNACGIRADVLSVCYLSLLSHAFVAGGQLVSNVTVMSSSWSRCGNNMIHSRSTSTGPGAVEVRQQRAQRRCLVVMARQYRTNLSALLMFSPEIVFELAT